MDVDPLRYDRALAFLLGRVNYERGLPTRYEDRIFKLARMADLLRRIGNPHERIPVLHVAGTKGKGSTATMLAAVLTAAGYRTGLFSSPHLFRVEERMAVDGAPAEEPALVELIERLQPIVAEMDAAGDEGGPTYFELTTALGWMYFERKGVDLAVLEVGLGGRLDSTNICRPIATVITSISFDHMAQLGRTLAAIAREKAGIAKPGIPCISGVVNDEPRLVIEEVCQATGCPLIQLGRDFDFTYHPPGESTVVSESSSGAPRGGTIDFRAEESYSNVAIAMLGRHQAANAAVAIAALHEVRRAGWRIPEHAIRDGLAKAVCLARVQIVRDRPTVIVDAAHNGASVAALVNTIDENFSGRRRWLIFATTTDKDVRGMLEILLPRFDEIVFTRYTMNPRGMAIDDLAALATELGRSNFATSADMPAAWDHVRSRVQPNDVVCMTGSFFAAAEMLKLVDPAAPAPTASAAM